MSIPKEPRQIMINLMYLVLTALLALNVSNEILNAFKTLSISIDKSNRSIDQKNDEVYTAIKENEKAPGQAEKVRPYREKADMVVKQADDMVKYLDDWKKRIILQAGGYNVTSHEPEDKQFPQNMENIDATTLLLVEKKGGDTMKKRITDLRAFMLSVLRPDDTAQISPLMPLRVTPAKKNEHNPTGDWSIENFEHMPSVAAIALFSKMQNDVRSSEALVLKRLFEEAHLKDIKFDTIGAVAVPKTSYALEGQKIEASILLAAFNKAQKPVISGMSGGGSTKPAENGIIPWETVAKGTGLQTVRGQIKLETESGPIVRDWKFEYMVGSTGASMQLDKMNVFYIGVANPVTYAAAGYSVEDVYLDIPGAEVRADSFNRKGHNNIWVSKLDKGLEVNIMARTQDKKTVKVGNMTVRVKRIPNPVAEINSISSGAMNAAIFRAQIAPAAVLKDFEFNARFQIISFSFSMQPKGKDYVGPFTAANRSGTRFNDNPNIVAAMKSAKAGDKVFIEDIKAVGPDGQTRTLNTIILNLN
jgi:gliding motility-associated protein GldM